MSNLSLYEIDEKDLKISELNEDEQRMTKLYPIERKINEPAFETKEIFLENFEIFTQKLLKNLNWNNVVCSSSAVIGSLLPVPKEYKTESEKRLYCCSVVIFSRV